MSMTSLCLSAVFPYHLLILNNVEILLLCQSPGPHLPVSFQVSVFRLDPLQFCHSVSCSVVATVSVISVFCFKEAISLTNRMSSFSSKLKENLINFITIRQIIRPMSVVFHKSVMAAQSSVCLFQKKFYLELHYGKQKVAAVLSTFPVSFLGWWGREGWHTERQAPRPLR